MWQALQVPEGRHYLIIYKNIYSREIVAENVRFTARSFWEQVSFYDNHDGNLDG
jgi:hypothetical protein